VQVLVDASALGTKSGSLSIGASPGGNLSIPLSANITPALTISPASGDLGTVVAKVMAAGVAMFTVRNALGAPRTGMLAISLSGAGASDFTAEGCSGALDPGAGCAIAVHFLPASAGAKSATLTVSGSPGGVVTASLTGKALPEFELSPASYDFGEVPQGTPPISTTFTFKNNRATSITYDFFVSEAGLSPFSLGTGHTCVKNGMLLSGGSCTINVLFKGGSWLGYQYRDQLAVLVAMTTGGAYAHVYGTTIAP
jgi:hypothetical protein